MAQPNKKYRKNPETFFNNKTWNDEIINSHENTENIAGLSPLHTAANKVLEELARNTGEGDS